MTTDTTTGTLAIAGLFPHLPQIPKAIGKGAAVPKRGYDRVAPLMVDVDRKHGGPRSAH